MKIYHLDTPIINFKNESPLTIRDLCNNVGVFGGTGTGKSSGIGRYLAIQMLSNGFGGIVLTCKADECAQWEEYCRLTGRSKDLIVVRPKGKYRFNVLEYLSTQDSEKTFTRNIVEVLRTVLNARNEKEGNNADSAFWKTAMEMLLTNVIDLCLAAYGKCSISLIYDIGLSIASEDNESDFAKALNIVKQKVADKMEAWTKRVGQQYLDSLSDADFNEALFKAIPLARQLKLMDQFFSDSYQKISSKTRTTIEFMFMGFLYSLLQDPLYSLFFDGDYNFKPENCLDGAIIIIDLPVKIYNEVGRDIQIMWKYIWQRAMEKRDIKKNARPLFIFGDEAHHFTHEFDAEFQTTSRSNRICSVYLSQSLSNYYAYMGGEASQHKVKSFLGTLSVKLFFANADIDTNKYASELIGQAWQGDETETVTNTDGSITTSKAVSVKLQDIVRVNTFNTMQTGGPLYGNRVSAYIHVQGKRFSNGFSHRLIHFNQNYIPNIKI